MMVIESRTERPAAPAERPKVGAGYIALALRIQEQASCELSGREVVDRLQSAVQAAHADSGQYAYYLNHYGDHESGDVVYGHGGDTWRAPYEIQQGAAGTSPVARVDTEARQKVEPHVNYLPVNDDDDGDGYAAMSEAARAAQLYSEVPAYERFVSKAERDKADDSDFAGKGKSFPILKPADVQAAVHAMGRAGANNYGPAELKRRIIAIAKRKGWAKELPKAWQGDGAQESASATAAGLRLVECASADEVFVQEAAGPSEFSIKLIAPGKGAMAWYPADVLRRDGPQAFPSETKVYLNHPVGAEEAEAPGNRDINRLAGVLTEPAKWQENGPKGPGLYSKFKVFADHAGQLAEKAKHLAMSIVASGEQAVEEGKRVFREGLPVLAKLTRGDSVDIVPIAGAGGMILTEAARAAAATQAQEVPMNEQEKAQLQEALRTNAMLVERALRSEAITEAGRILREVSLPSPIKTVVVENVIERPLPKTATGTLDTIKLSEALMAEARRLGAAFAEATGAGEIRGLGGQATAQVDATTIQAQEAEIKAREAAERQIWAELMPGAPASAIERAWKGRAA